MCQRLGGIKIGLWGSNKIGNPSETSFTTDKQRQSKEAEFSIARRALLHQPPLSKLSLEVRLLRPSLMVPYPTPFTALRLHERVLHRGAGAAHLDGRGLHRISLFPTRRRSALRHLQVSLQVIWNLPLHEGASSFRGIFPP